MVILELLQPGMRVTDYSDEDRPDADGLLRLVTTCVAEIAVSSSLLEEVHRQLQPVRREPMSPRPDGPSSGDRFQGVWQRLLQERMPNTEDEKMLVWREAIAVAQAEANREAWQAGTIPSVYLNAAAAMYIRSFIHALHVMQLALGKLTAFEGCPNGVSEALDDFKSHLPQLTGVRNSLQHPEDRHQGKARDKRLELKPISTPGISSAGGALVLGMWQDGRFGTVLEDGSFGEVDLSGRTITLAQQTAQRVIDAHSWTGPWGIHPEV